MPTSTIYTCLTFNELTLQQLYDMMVLRQEVFVVEQNCPYLDADSADQKAWHLMGYQNDKLVAYTRLLPKGTTYEKYPSIGRVITAQSIRRAGEGRTLMEKSLDWSHKLFGQTPIKISAQCYLVRFYESLGFETVGEEYLEDDIPHIAMVKE